jgi:hypothetical protein
VIIVIGLLLLVMWRRVADPNPGLYLETGKKASLSKT